MHGISEISLTKENPDKDHYLVLLLICQYNTKCSYFCCRIRKVLFIMRFISSIKALPYIIILLLISNTVIPQVVVERSKNKVIISGTPYYVHIVKKGETAYSISRAYGVSVEELTKENPPAVFGVKEGQSLLIPVRSVTMSITSDTISVKKQKDESKFIYHILKPGETIYSLSKSYGVSENEIISSNPGIDINKLSVGTELAIPRREFMNDRQKFDNQEKQYFFHKVLRGESLSSIAQKYGLTVRELRRENRDLRFPQVGDFVRVPGVDKYAVTKEELKADTTAIVTEEPVIRLERPYGFTPLVNLRGTINVAVLLPFYLRQNAVRTEIDSSKYSRGKKIYKTINKPEDWIYPASVDFIEMYEGILLAADTLRSLGLNINIYTYDIQRDTIELTKLISSGKLSFMDLIIGPVYSHNLSLVASYAKNLDIPVVSPVPLINNSALLNNPTLFMANSSLRIAQEALSKKVSEYWDNNIVFIHADTAGNDPVVNRFKNMIFTELSYKIPYDDIKFKEFTFYSKSMFNNDSINRLSHALSEISKNTIIIASEDASVMSETIMDIHGLSRKFDIQVFCYPAVRDLDNFEQKILFDLGIMLYTPYWIDYSKNDVRQFNADFRKKFLTEPFEKSYAWEGYDIAYYFLSGLAVFGKDFIVHPEIHNPDLLHTEYNFVRKYISDGFENQNLYLIKYTKDYNIILLGKDTDFQEK